MHTNREKMIQDMKTKTHKINGNVQMISSQYHEGKKMRLTEKQK